MQILNYNLNMAVNFREYASVPCHCSALLVVRLLVILCIDAGKENVSIRC